MTFRTGVISKFTKLLAIQCVTSNPPTALFACLKDDQGRKVLVSDETWHVSSGDYSFLLQLCHLSSVILINNYSAYENQTLI